jgi:uncharacterized protein (DUF362 family)
MTLTTVAAPYQGRYALFMRPAKDARVILRRCEDYDSGHIKAIVAEALTELGLVPRGRVLVKPNLVMAGELFQYAYTRPEVAQGVLEAIKDAGQGITELGIGERCGITVPTRYVFEQAGYERVLRRTGAVPHYFDEVSQVEVPLTHAGRLRDAIYVPEPVARADFFVNVPKFKAHPWTTVTFSLKNYIGIQDDRHRLIDHDWALNRKIADLQHVVQPELVVIDAITAGQGRMLTPIPYSMGMLVLGNNQVAVDAVCCRIVGLDPREVEHIRLAHEDGFGPLDGITVTGDVTIEQARERAKDFKLGLIRVEKYFEGTHLTCYAGPPPGGSDGYCWGGCPGALEEAIEVLRLYDEQCDQKMARMHIVFGDYKGPLDVSYGEKIIFVGDCVQFEGNVGGALVRIESLYKDRSTLDPTTAPDPDIYKKMVSVLAKVEAARNKPFLRLPGCPVSVAELILALSMLGGVNNPYLSPQEAVRFTKHYVTWRIASLGKRISGNPSLVRGFTERGEGKPELS